MSDIKKKGSKQEVWEGKAVKTAGGLEKKDLMLNKKGKVVSLKMSEKGQRQIKKNRENNFVAKKPLVKEKEESEEDEEEDKEKEQSPIRELKEEKEEKEVKEEEKKSDDDKIEEKAEGQIVKPPIEQSIEENKQQNEKEKEKEKQAKHIPRSNKNKKQ